jgi:hypothetical protein
MYGFGSSVVQGFHFGFLPPTGVGLAVSASGITGGGFLAFDDANRRYSGALTLNFNDIGLSAVGLITTRMPDGSAGFALLITIGATFNPPAQLAFGFTLLGVGGLIAVNRALDVDALRGGLKHRTLDAILFPDPATVVANAAQTISALGAVFPQREGRFVVGPMLKIGWGSPTIITGDIGVFIEIPGPPRLVVLGQIETALPEAQNALVVIHLDILGVIDFQSQELTFQAALYDSRILSFTLSGDAAFVLGWGRNPRFALSLGGFHPKFTPPPPAIVFADLKRLTLAISAGSGLQLACQAYLALTPSSLQFGAQLNLRAAKGGLEAEGYLGFDALFILSPFSFEVEIRGGVHIKYKGVSLFGVDLSLLLSGPTPWHARGKTRIKILFFSISVGFSFTWGDDRQATLPAVDPWVALPDGSSLPKVLEKPASWGSMLPAAHGMVEALGPIEAGALVVHPAGRLEVRQNLVPLGIGLQKVGNAPISGHDRFEIVVLRVGNTNLALDPVEEYFARGQFEDLSVDQCLALPAFEKMQGGVTTRAADTTIRVDGSVETKTLGYECILIRPDHSSEQQGRPGRLAWDEAQFAVGATVARRAAQRAGAQRRFSPARPQPQVELREERYCIAHGADLRRVQLDTQIHQENRNMTRAAADRALKAQIGRHPEQARVLLVILEHEVAG